MFVLLQVFNVFLFFNVCSFTPDHPWVSCTRSKSQLLCCYYSFNSLSIDWIHTADATLLNRLVASCWRCKSSRLSKSVYFIFLYTRPMYYELEKIKNCLYFDSCQRRRFEYFSDERRILGNNGERQYHRWASTIRDLYHRWKLIRSVPDYGACYWCCSIRPIQEIGPRPRTRKRKVFCIFWLWFLWLLQFRRNCCHQMSYFKVNYNHLTASFPGQPGWAGTRKVNQSGFYWSKRQWVAVASAGPYASLHLSPDR